MAFCDCPEEGTSAWYGNSVTYVREEKRWVCGRTGLDPKPAAHGKMIAGAGPYVKLMELSDEMGVMAAQISNGLGKAARLMLDEVTRNAFKDKPDVDDNARG